jgi:radical SAM modification target selenobiotic family peptide
MDARDLKKILAGITVSSLLAGSALFLGGCPEQGKSG